MYIIDIETALFIEFKQNPFIFEDVTLFDTMFYVERFYNMMADKYENMDTDDILGTLLQRLL